jgi:hypothetical protein
LKIQSTAPSRPVSSSTTNVGPWSRIQYSSTGASMISISPGSMRVARAISLGSTSIVTGVCAATAAATAVHVAYPSSRSASVSPSVVPSTGNAIQMRSWGAVSAACARPWDLLWCQWQVVRDLW